MSYKAVSFIRRLDLFLLHKEKAKQYAVSSNRHTCPGSHPHTTPSVCTPAAKKMLCQKQEQRCPHSMGAWHPTSTNSYARSTPYTQISRRGFLKLQPRYRQAMHHTGTPSNARSMLSHAWVPLQSCSPIKGRKLNTARVSNAAVFNSALFTASA